MKNTVIVYFLIYLEPFACSCALLFMRYRGQLRQFRFVTAYLSARIVSQVFLIALIELAKHHVITQRASYYPYFYIYWASYAVEAMLGFGIIYSLFRMAMAPLKGLQRLGMLMFRWAAGIALALATTMAFGPHVTEQRFITKFVTQLQQTQSVLTLCMLLFVCLAIRPMGLTHRSKIFGVSLGLGVLATADLVSSAWLPHNKSLSSAFEIVNGVSICVALAIWMAYLAIPEPRRRMIILPTTSPFLRWNQISIALGDEPGFVALGDVTPDMLAPAELEIMRRASAKMTRTDLGALPVPMSM